jgi:hypothetical protein
MPTSFELQCSANQAAFVGVFTIAQFRRVLAGLHGMIHVRGAREVGLDFSTCKFTHAPPMLVLGTICEHYIDKGVKFELTLPSHEPLKRLFLNSNWAHIIQPDAYPPSRYRNVVHMPALRYDSSEAQHHLVNQLMDKLLASVTDFTRKHLKAIEWSINEITDNVLVHSKSPHGGFVQLTANRPAKRIEFVVCDGGIGIPRSLKSSGLQITSDVDALAKAIEQGVTRDRSIGQGNGLYGSYRIAVLSGANFSLHSGNATLYHTPKDGMHTRRDNVPMVGTMVVCGIDYTQPLLLEEALNIKELRFDPVDFVETKYETRDDGDIAFTLRNESDSFGSRVAGTPVRNKIKNLLSFLPDKKVVVDFDGINLVSSSFADEVFGKLFLELGPVDFSAKLQFMNIDPTVKLLIDKAIMQRMSSPVRA